MDSQVPADRGGQPWYPCDWLITLDTVNHQSMYLSRGKRVEPYLSASLANTSLKDVDLMVCAFFSYPAHFTTHVSSETHVHIFGYRCHISARAALYGPNLSHHKARVLAVGCFPLFGDQKRDPKNAWSEQQKPVRSCRRVKHIKLPNDCDARVQSTRAAL